MRCAQCGFENPEKMNFCGQCGASLAVAPGTRAERRQLTVLFCDLVGSTSIADRLDPEDYRELVQDYHDQVARQVERFEGRIAQYLGDGVLVYFGHPVAHEDDADRAVRAAQRIVEGVAVASRWDYSVRAGLHTGRVVVSEIGAGDHREALALGPTPNVAARLQQLAEPNTVVLSAATRRLLKGGFRLADLGEHTLRGVQAPAAVFRVEGLERSSRARSVAVDRPMVDREPQKERLAELWSSVEQGSRAAVVLQGEAGIGKSRIAEWLLNEELDAARFVARCSQRHGHAGLYPMAELLRAELGLDPADGPERTQEEVVQEFARLDLGEESVVPLVTSLLASAPLGDEIEELSATLRRRRVHDFLRRWLAARSEERPILLVVDDVHWADPSTMDWVVDFVGAEDGLVGEDSVRAMVLLTARPEFELPSAANDRWHSISVDRLPERYVQEMLDVLGVGGSLGEDRREELFEKTDGVPLFVEELTRMLTDHLDDYVGSQIPATLEDLLMARLDQLGPERVTAQWAATIGRTFATDLLHEVVPSPPDEVSQHVGSLIGSGIFERVPGEASLRFRHALIQDAAYQALLRSERREFHGRIAAVLSDPRDGGLARPELLAHHFREAGDLGRAARYFRDAGTLALARSDNHEAIALLRESLACLEQTPESAERASSELACYVALGAALVAVNGYGASEVSEVHASVHELSHRTGDRQEMFRALRATLPYYLVRSRMQTALEVGETLVETASELADDGLLLEAHTSLATPCFWLGDVTRSREEAARAMALYDPDRHRGHVAQFGQDPFVLCLLYTAWSSWWLGDISQAISAGEDAVAAARRSEHKHTLALALDHTCSLHLYLRDHSTARRLVDEGRRVAADCGFAMWIAMGTFRSAWLDCVEGNLEKGLEQMQKSLAAFRLTGAAIARPLHLGYLAEAFTTAGMTERGLEAISEGLEAVEDSGERHHEPELYRLRGDLLLDSDRETALDALGHGFDLAEDRGSLSLALRAGVSLARAEPQSSERRRALADVVGRFAPNAEMADLSTARTLLGVPE